MGDVLDFAGHRPSTVADDDGEWEVATDFPALAADLRLAWQEIQEADCPGNINADIPAMVLTDLAAMALDQWEGHSPAMGRAELLATMCGALAYMLDWFKSGADDGERKRLSARNRPALHRLWQGGAHRQAKPHQDRAVAVRDRPERIGLARSGSTGPSSAQPVLRNRVAAAWTEGKSVSTCRHHRNCR